MENLVNPTGIEVSNNEQVLEIEWSDGVKSVYPLFGLRKNCPCVMCRGGHAHMNEFEPKMFFQITWADGHNSGMYRWETLRFLDPENHKE